MKYLISPLLLFPACFLLLSPRTTKADTLRITSEPSEATVEIDGKVVGTTPYEMKVPGGYFHRTHTAFGSRLRHPMTLRASKDGYVTNEITMTDGPMRWISLNGANHGDYWLLKMNHFHVVLEAVSKTLTGAIVATIAGNTRIEMRPELPVEEIVRKSKPAVVLLKQPDSQGSGFFITDTGVIATNAHVARGAETMIAILPTGQKIKAKVVYIDAEMDIALVKVEGGGFPHLPLADIRTVRQGQTVVAIGSPRFSIPFAVTKGVVSAVGTIAETSGTWIQTDTAINTAINPGNSGGPLLNTYGEVVGINTLKTIARDVQSINFALSSTDLMEILYRFYPAVSVTSSPSPQAPDGNGTLIISSDPDSAEVYVDGKFAGNVPATLKLPVGPHTIQLKFPGRVDWERSVEILKDSQVNLKGQLATGK